jgi:beta-lactamase regulating signal transducer with metallopeptidase domain
VKLLESFAHWPMTAWIGWALLHFLWQGALLGVLLSVLLRLQKRSNPAGRYTVACGTLLLMSLCPIATTLELQRHASISVQAQYASPSLDVRGRTAPLSGNAAPVAFGAAEMPGTDSAEAPSAMRPVHSLPIWAFGIWFGGVTLLLVRLLGGWLLVQRLIRRSSRPVAGTLNASLISLAKRMGIRRLPRLIECDGVGSPSLVGGLRSAVLLPGSALTGLSTQMLESLLAHELAHLKRHDYLVNLWQSAVETFLFYHPAVWWVSKTIRLEREHCCDDVVVSVLRAGATYARALATLEELRWQPAVLAASGGDLSARIRRIVSPDSAGNAKGPSALFSLALAVSLVLALFAAGGRFTPRATAAGQQHAQAIDRRDAADRRSDNSIYKPRGDAVRDTINGGLTSRATVATSTVPEASLPSTAIQSHSDREISRGRGLTANEAIARSLASGVELPPNFGFHELKRPVPDAQIGSSSRPSEQSIAELSSSGIQGIPKALQMATENGKADQPPNHDPANEPPTKTAKFAVRLEPTIAEISVIGNKVLNSQAIISLSGHKVGDPCTTEALTEMRDKLTKSRNFGMHHPDQSDQWVRVQAEDIGDNKCKVTITVDENDKITGITITGSGPIKPEEVMALISPSAVYNVAYTARDTHSIIDLYNRQGYSIDFGKELGMDPSTPGVLVVPIIVSRVEDIEILKDGVKFDDPRLLRQLSTRAGDYFNRKTFYEADRKKLTIKRYVISTITERKVGAGRVHLSIDFVTKRRKH